MNSNTKNNEADLAENQQMLQLRQLVLGENNQLIRDVVKEDARTLVSSVLTEALHDRQKSDASVSAVLAPLVEKSVETSVVARKTQFVSYLYPLVGGLVRKAVSTSIAGIIEQTNELLESSLTYKGLRWRFEARRAGVSYSQYVVRQTFEFRVEQVLLIHRETGLLLKTVVNDKTQTTDGDMFSAMLTAINDFVADSFSSEQNEQSLDEIKTDDFTLLIKQGPEAVIVAAVTGNPPASIADKLQLTLENIHQVYHRELKGFEGDASDFENTDQQLNDCLLSQQKATGAAQRKIPWLAIVLLCLVVSIFGFFIAKHWYLDYQAESLHSLMNVPGIVLLDATRCENKICVDVLRDPIAKDVASLAMLGGVSKNILQVNERAYRSLDARLLPERLLRIQKDFSELDFNLAELKFSGSLSVVRLNQLKARLNAMPEKISVTNLLHDVTVLRPDIPSTLLNELVLEQKISAIRQTHLLFNVNESDLFDSTLNVINQLSAKIIKATDLAYEMNQNFVVVIMGTSTKGGTLSYNQKLSRQRAESVKKALISNGVEPEILRVAGLGSLSSNDSIPRVVFDVVRLMPENTDDIEKVRN